MEDWDLHSMDELKIKHDFESDATVQDEPCQEG